MRRRNCVRNLDTPLVCARRHRQITMKCAYFNEVALMQFIAGTRLGIIYMRALRGLVDVKQRKQIICNLRFEREVKLVRL